jgi:hypothetical protein
MVLSDGGRPIAPAEALRRLGYGRGPGSPPAPAGFMDTIHIQY